MYTEIKRLIKSVIPKTFLFHYEPKFRLVLYQFYKGENYQCNLCNKTLRKFIIMEDGERLCPFCGSLSRTRRLWDILSSGYIKKGICILDFSPSRSLYRVLKNSAGISYSSTDISGDFLADFQFDITNIDAEKDTYDLIICYHILEHIERDMKAMQEIYRVMKKGGTCIIQTPFNIGDIYEDLSVATELERLKHFGQKDHVRIYSVGGLKDRLVRCGFQVTVRQFTDIEDNKFGFKEAEAVLICTK